MITPLSLATEGFIDDRSPLSMATRGLIKLPVEVAEVIIVKRGGRIRKREIELIPFPWKTEMEPVKMKIEERKDPDRNIHYDDEEILRILIELITNGYLN